MKTLDLKVLISDGYLQEVNRGFFHPLGLALAVTMDGGTLSLAILDARNDPEGFKFADGEDLFEKSQLIRARMVERMGARFKALGYWHQPIEKG